ncbi:ABC transporter substrate-binding protein [Chelatococcus asaccharovorans]|uniref:Peptide/nickel transport system substrate-binding protein n=1 Tax=Chelatococcus asaccharovorans TaxID=28210 RepID=A0A2V3U8I8_9HYPH|nr:ABC transporter substrate-binding protein [Chelatococcus asaccharovorans]MBS7705470.1 ABC transporter substrate-binding protein [Chelatococcus asaccharovorans]PXW60126.1 peptide/nickel transport system substrate-binding protein [Chelatococcus asaccharovorans]
MRVAKFSLHTIRAIFLLLILGCPIQGFSQELRVGVQVGPTTLDPHFFNYFANIGNLGNIYEALVTEDREGKIQPQLATSWETVTPTEWLFHLREGVKFHNGAAFGAQDVAFSIARTKTVQGSPGSFVTFTAQIKAVEVIGPLTLKITTFSPAPYFLFDLARVFIVSAGSSAASTAEYNQGTAAIGTGPFRSASWSQNAEWMLQRNDAWWGAAPPWASVRVRIIPNDAARVAALLAKDVDLIDRVPSSDMARLEASKQFAVSSRPGLEVFVLNIDTQRETSPFARAPTSGQTKNPLREPAIRRALSLAINRKLLVDRVFEQSAVPAFELSDVGDQERTGLAPQDYDPVQAKALLAEGGFPDGFELTLHGFSGVIAGDVQLIQGVAQFFSRVGVKTRVETMPPTVLFPGASRGEWSIYLTGSTTPYAIAPYKFFVMTPNPDKGYGSGNRLRFSNDRLDDVLSKALVTMDATERLGLIKQAATLVRELAPVIPLFHPVYSWASNREVADYEAWALPFTRVMYARPTAR